MKVYAECVREAGVSMRSVEESETYTTYLKEKNMCWSEEVVQREMGRSSYM